MSSNIHSTGQYKVSTADIDCNKRLTIPSLMKAMQKAAMQNVIKLNLSVWDLEPHKLTWVLMKMDLNIKSLPKLGEAFSVSTNPSGFEKFFTYRDYKVTDANNETIALASSTWLLMNSETRRMSRIPDFILAHQTPTAKTSLPRATFKLADFEDSSKEQTYHVNWFDLDFNQHLNYGNYIKWMLEMSELNLLKNKFPTSFQIIYRAEALLNDEILSEQMHLQDQEYLHRLRRKSDQKDLAIAKISWSNNVST